MSVKVSAIVPVFNPGDHIDDCIRTLLDQSLAPGEYEVIFVDDGSTDATPARLDALAAAHRHVRVEHIPNSGWPGRPRNVGIDLARGEFVLFVDNDDWVTHDALERLYERAVADDADVVLGKVIGHGTGKKIPRGVFRANRSNVTFDWSGLVWLLTPHKLFRRSLLDEHRIRFPEGRRRLEDHVFVMHAYFHAQGRISVLADHTIYHWVMRGQDLNASTRAFDPASYFADLRDVLDLIDEHTEPGDLRDRLYLRWYRGKVLGRVGGWTMARLPDDQRRGRYEEVRRLTLERFAPHLDARLLLAFRVRAAYLRAGAYDALVPLGKREHGLRPVLRVVAVERDGDALVLRLESTFHDEHGLVRFERAEGRLAWAVPDWLPALPIDARAADRDPPAGDVYLVLRSAADRSEVVVPATHEVRLEPVADADGRLRPVVSTTARIDPATAAAGAPLAPGTWEVWGTLGLEGFDARGRARRRRGGRALRLRVEADGRLVEQRAEQAPAPAVPRTDRRSGPRRLRARRPVGWVVRALRRVAAALTRRGAAQG